MGSAQLVEAQTREQSGQDQRKVAFGPIGAARRLMGPVNCL